MTFSIAADDYCREPLVLVEIALDSGSAYYAKTEVSASERHYTGYGIKFGQVARKLNPIDSRQQVSNLTLSFANSDGYFSRLNNEKLLNREVTIKIGFAGEALSDFITVMTGVIAGCEFDMQNCRLQVKELAEKYWGEDWHQTIKKEDWPQAASGAVGRMMPIYCGELAAESGACPAFLVDASNCKWLVAGHAVKAVTKVYQNGTAISFTACPTEDFNEGKITTIIVPGTDAADTITVDLQGAETVGDGSGTLIINPVDALEWFLKERVGLSEAKIDAESFAAARILAETRGFICSGGAVNATNAREVVLEMLLSMGAWGWFDAAGVFKLKIFEPQLSEAGNREFTEQNEILQGSYRLSLRTENLVNSLTARYEYLPKEDKCQADLTRENGFSQNNLDKTYSKTFALKWTAKREQVLEVAARILLLYRYPLAEVTFQGPLSALASDLGDLTLLTHRVGMGTTDGEFKKRAFAVTGLSADLDRYQVKVELTDMQAWSARGRFWLGDRELQAATWPGASDGDARYGYLCNRTTGEFNNGDEGKCLY